MRYLILVLCFISQFTPLVGAQNPPSIIVSGNQEFCGESAMPVVSSVSITDNNGTNGTLEAIHIQISQGYSVGQDQLTLMGIHPNITTTWSIAEGELTLQGPGSYQDFMSAIEDVRFQTTQTNFTEDKFFSINLGDANFLPSTGHYYFYVLDVGITWTQAKLQAEGLEYFGLQGYLATLTTAEEAQLAGEQSQGTGWIGANDVATEAIWEWVTGPEAGTAFYNQNTGQAINGGFSFWNTGEPNDFNGEDYAHITDPSVGILGSWNDLPNQGDSPGSPYHPQGFVVEFGGMPDDPDINVSASTVIITPKLEFIEDEVCNSGVVNLSVTSNTDTVLWFETPSSSTILNSGFTYSTVLNTTTTFWLSPLFDGCNDGARVPFTAIVNPSPEANNLEIFQCNDTADNDGVSVFNLNAYLDAINTQNNQDIQILFFLDDAFTIPINANNYTNTTNGQIIYTQVIDNSTGCISSAQITLRVRLSTFENVTIALCDDANEDGITTFTLSDADSEILAGLPLNFTVSYYETYEDALLQQNTLGATFTNTTPNNQIIYARVNEDVSCYAISEVNLEVIRLPNIEEQETRYYCLNNFPQTITLTGGIEGEDFNNFYYEWSTGEDTSEIEVNEPGLYTVIVTATNGCSKYRNISVIGSNIATIESILIQDVSENNTVTVLISGDGEYEYAIDDSNGFYQASNVFENVDAGFHTIYVRDVKNDCGTVFKEISVIGFPKFFTPNGDVYNQTWKIKGLSGQFFPNTKLYIFDRFGKILAKINPSEGSWDGTYNGELMPTDDYWFTVKLHDGRVFENHFTLKR